MGWNRILSDAGLTDKEANAVIALSNRPNIKASELAKELGTTRLDAYNSLERLQRIGLVTSTADRPMRFSSPPIGDVVKMLIDIRREQLSRIEENYKGLNNNSNTSEILDEKAAGDAKFAVLKERIHILKRIEKMAEEAENLQNLLNMFRVDGEETSIIQQSDSEIEEINSEIEQDEIIQIPEKTETKTGGDHSLVKESKDLPPFE